MLKLKVKLRVVKVVVKVEGMLKALEKEADDADEKQTCIIGHRPRLIYMLDMLRRRHGIADDFPLRCCYTPR